MVYTTQSKESREKENAMNITHDHLFAQAHVLMRANCDHTRILDLMYSIYLHTCNSSRQLSTLAKRNYNCRSLLHSLSLGLILLSLLPHDIILFPHILSLQLASKFKYCTEILLLELDLLLSFPSPPCTS